MRVPEVLALPVAPADAVISYGPDSLQFGELRLPSARNQPFPVVVIIHGGCWLSAYDLHLMDAMATSLTEAGYATWNLEYRRVGDREGAWPNTFLDVAKGVNYLREIADEYQLDLDHVVVTGHSAGGHLALWLGAQDQLPAGSELKTGDPLPLSGVVSLAGIVDPAGYLVREGQSCGTSVDELIGGLPENMPERYRQASPLQMAPLGVRQVLVSGMEDPIVPLTHLQPYFEQARAKGDRVKIVKVKNAGHFEVIAPGSVAWPKIEKAIRKLSRKTAN
ncbi:alpha/beta hydrolase [Flavilitoribacter nigricans DSM 23189 = NBRC 102662]|uniref:Alpha/beta hydrolase n=2 Tax=Flavilitoribacter TaxID=2762562 RepID=A0A2D0NG46_FLAN2|nr:alpha/beta hydrolase [Flavilitoribacter nigricans DSM 23189 = NBRC 102662]